ncbi:MAG: hypothetical protein NZ927_01890 [Candidatus Calescibacterium sp.]|nr:hypothetical protein [Candidatus Calescibacterium sp.]MDW8086816.1 hypothetical protein [Candidatus Calescibacterium sp.]
MFSFLIKRKEKEEVGKNQVKIKISNGLSAYYDDSKSKNGKDTKGIYKIKSDEEIGEVGKMSTFEQKEVTLFYVEELHKEAVRVKHIQELAKHELPVKMMIPGDERSYFVLFEKVAVSKNEYVCLVREPDNPKYKEALKPQVKVKFEYSDTNGKFSFESYFKGMFKGSLVFSLPEKIDRVSGRSAHRVKPDPAEPIEVVIEIPNFGTHKGMLVDINEYGLGLDVQVPKDKIQKMSIASLAFRLPTKEGAKKHEWALVSAKGEIRFIGDGEGGKTRIGLQFTQILDDDRKIVRDYWLMRQRQELKRKLEYES